MRCEFRAAGAISSWQDLESERAKAAAGKTEAVRTAQVERQRCIHPETDIAGCRPRLDERERIHRKRGLMRDIEPQLERFAVRIIDGAGLPRHVQPRADAEREKIVCDRILRV